MKWFLNLTQVQSAGATGQAGQAELNKFTQIRLQHRQSEL